jgi:hypothetical protein
MAFMAGGSAPSGSECRRWNVLRFHTLRQPSSFSAECSSGAPVASTAWCRLRAVPVREREREERERE